MAMTIEQQRAADAWKKCASYGKQHVTLAKGLPALIINSGLMQVLAFCEQKDDKYGHKKVAADLRAWLSHRFPNVVPKADFADFMQHLMKARPQDFQAINAEAFAWLKWLRQLAAAHNQANQKDGD